MQAIKHITPPHRKECARIKERYDAIDGLRAYAAIGIVLMHIWANISIKPTESYLTKTIIPWFSDFTLMFMVVSGFSLCCGYYERIKKGAITPNEFYKKRYMRILPFFAILCLIDFAASPSVEQIYQLFANITLCFNLIPNVDITMIGVGWFLGVVFLFYLLFPFFVFMLDNKLRGWISMAVALTLAGICTIYTFNEDVVAPTIGRTNIVYCMPLFMAGGMIYLYREKLKMKGVKRWTFFLVCVAFTVAFFASSGLRHGKFAVLASEMVLFGSWLIYAVSSEDSILNNRITKFVNGISMEIYLCHMMIYRAVEHLHLERFVDNADFHYMATCLIVIVGAVLFAWGMKKFVLVRIKL